ncbi:sugar phosphate isomerase/epimerase [Granulicella aggregans]|uniref:Sugar phosphate isomerase/epimerase n=1 Tax=Granulicella aggregans TaxID=474949 RepID=A0A7W8E2Z1_9BACT|nr:sugar phosphate isomerase/epimerase [Granulicella aggregans]MBB5056689.1 sugar phosphate isomerase/epimerase [Granulicella aggregans]
MKLGLFTPLFAKLSFVDLLKELKLYPEITALEIGCGGWPGASHINPAELLASAAAAKEYRVKLADAGLTISALSCHGNPVHPDPAIARREDETFKQTVRLAEALEVPVVVTFSGCPGASADDKTPNWITAAWPPEFAQGLEWQWSERLVPYWIAAEKMAAAAGVKIALEAHPGFCVYNPETLLKLRSATGKSLGINLDPSHLWWQQIDIPEAIAELGDAIFHFHAKDVAVNPARVGVNGVLDTKSYTQLRERSWLFRSVGWGHSEIEWKKIASALRLVGYDYVMSIEHEDALMSTHEGLSSAIGMLSRVLMKEEAVEAWWV